MLLHKNSQAGWSSIETFKSEKFEMIWHSDFGGFSQINNTVVKLLFYVFYTYF